MPPLTGVGERYAPKATGSCIDEPLQLGPVALARLSLLTPVKGRAWRHRLLRVPWHGQAYQQPNQASSSQDA